MRSAERQLLAVLLAAPGSLALQCPRKPSLGRGAAAPGEPKANPSFVCAFSHPPA